VKLFLLTYFGAPIIASSRDYGTIESLLCLLFFGLLMLFWHIKAEEEDE